MPYLFHQNKHFTLVDYNAKNGVFCQFFSAHLGKPLLIASPGTKDYCAVMNDQDQLLIAAMPDSCHLNLHLLEGSHFTKRSLIANTTSNYTLSCPMLYLLDTEQYTTYVSHQNETTTYNFVQENINSPNLTILYTLNLPPYQIKCISPTPQITYIFFITHDENYHIYALEITHQQTTLIKYLTSPVPIIDYSVCCHEQTMHISYVAELHGKYQLCYFNNQSQYITSVITTLSPCKPVIFYYYHALWINIQIGRDLQVLLSVDNGHSFSMPVNCSLQNNIRRCQFSTKDTSHLSAHELYVSVGAGIRLCTIAMADFYHYHADTYVPPELELLIEGLSLNRQPVDTAPHPSDPQRGNPPPPTPRPTQTKRDIESAKKAFMEELGGWDLPPRI